MRDNVKRLVEVLAQTFAVPEPICEIGSYQVPGQEGYADLRGFFPGKQYVGCDLRPGPGVDRLEDVHRLSLPDETAGAVLMIDTLEHVADPFQALAEICRVLRPDGLFLMTSVMDCPIHDYPSDYWRFTPEAFRLLLDRFSFKLVGFQGDPAKPHTVVGLASKSDLPADAVERYRTGTSPTVYS